MIIVVFPGRFAPLPGVFRRVLEIFCIAASRLCGLTQRHVCGRVRHLTLNGQAANLRVPFRKAPNARALAHDDARSRPSDPP